MKKRVFPAVLIGTILILCLVVFVPPLIKSPEAPSSTTFPWQVARTADGSTTVFGLVLGKSNLEDVKKVFEEEPEVSVFRKPDGEIVAEGYFNEVNRGGLTAKLGVALEASQEELTAIYERGVRSIGTESGAKKIELSGRDEDRVRALPIAGLTYIPVVNMKPEIVLKRFGEPAEKVKERDKAITHWFYPDVGVDIAISDEGKDVIQYVKPEDFKKLATPVKAMGEVVK